MKVVFLDRDGVINRFPGNGKYVTKVKDFHFIPGARKAIRLLTAAGYRIFVISNQAGVSKGVYSHDKLTRITVKMFNGVMHSGGRLAGVYYAISRNGEGCEYRKPNIGLIRDALNTLKKNLRSARRTFFVGDTESDIQAGRNAGCRTIFVLSGRENRRHTRQWQVQPDYVADDLLAAAKLIIHQNGDAPSATTVRTSRAARAR